MGTKLNEEYILAEVLSTPNNALRTSKGKNTNPFDHLLRERERHSRVTVVNVLNVLATNK